MCMVGTFLLKTKLLCSSFPFYFCLTHSATQVNPLTTRSDGSKVLASLLAKQSRCITSQQMDITMEHFAASNNLPTYLHCVSKVAMAWKSQTDASYLGNTVEEVIKQHFAEVC